VDQKALVDGDGDGPAGRVEGGAVAEPPDRAGRTLGAGEAAALEEVRPDDEAVAVDREARHEQPFVLDIAVPARVDQLRRTRLRGLRHEVRSGHRERCHDRIGVAPAGAKADAAALAVAKAAVTSAV